MSNSDENSIHIVTQDLEVTLRGDDESVARAYGALRDVLVDAFEAEDELPPPAEVGMGPTDETLDRGDTQPMHSPPQGIDPPSDAIDEEMSAAVRAVTPDGQEPNPGSFIQLVLRHDRYLKVHLLERQSFTDSFLGRSLDPTYLSRIYTDSDSKERLGERLDFGETLWRELTRKGRAEVEANGDFELEDAESEETDDG